MHVDVTKAIHIHGGLKIGEFVQFAFVLAPVELVLPMFVETLDVLLRSAIVPAGLV